jgi:hypothetical protein
MLRDLPRLTSGGSDVSAALSAQMATFKTPATALATAITAVPAGSESDPEAAAVKASADQFKASVTTLQSSVTALEGKRGVSKVAALASVGGAARDDRFDHTTAGRLGGGHERLSG